MPLLNTADAIYVGDILADAVYLGDVLVWEAVSWGSQERMLDPAITPQTNYTGDYTTGVKFTVQHDGRITHFANHNSDVTGTARMRLYDHGSGELLVEVPVPVFYGAQVFPLPEPVEVHARHTYMLTFYSGPTTTYPYQDVPPLSLSPNLTNMRGTFYAGDTYPSEDGNQYYWLDVVYQQLMNPPWTPAELPGLILGLESADAPTGLVTFWPDLSPERNDLVTAAGAVYGYGDFVTLSHLETLQSIAPILVTGAAPRHLMVAMRARIAQGPLMGYGTPGNGQLFDLYGYNQTMIWHGYNSSTSSDAPPPFPLNEWFVADLYYDGTTVGVTISSPFSDSPFSGHVQGLLTTSSPFLLGTGGYKEAWEVSDFDVAALYFYDRYLPPEERALVKEYLLDQTAGIPQYHPFRRES